MFIYPVFSNFYSTKERMYHLLQKFTVGCVIVLILIVGIQYITQAIPSWLMQIILWITIITFIYYVYNKRGKDKH